MPAKPGERRGDARRPLVREGEGEPEPRHDRRAEGCVHAVPQREGPQEKEEALEMRLPPTWVANDPENKVPEGDIRAAATLPIPGGSTSYVAL
jgi:hypothetical protein